MTHTKKKETVSFGSRMGFLAAATSSAIGLGNIWKFPYEVGMNGGASFLLVYVISVLLLGFPLVVAELAIGRTLRAGVYQVAQRWPTPLWRLWRSLIFLMLLLNESVYTLISGWVFGYAWQTFWGGIPADPGLFFTTFTQAVPTQCCYLLGALLPASFILYQGVKTGIERWAKVLLPVFFLMLVGLVVYALQLDHAWEGVRFYLWPRWDGLTGHAIFMALAHAFFSLSLGLGILVTYGAYMPAEDDIITAAATLAVGDTVVAFMAGLFLFPFIFSQGLSPTQGNELAFVALPLVFQSLGPMMGQLLGTIFFLLLLLAALTTLFSTLEVLVVYLMEWRGWSRTRSVVVTTVLVYAVTVPHVLAYGQYPFLCHCCTLWGKAYNSFELAAQVLAFALLGSCLLFVVGLARQWHELAPVIGPKNSFLVRYVQVMIQYGCPLLLCWVLALSWVYGG